MTCAQEKTGHRKGRADGLCSLFLLEGFLNVLVLCGLSGDGHWAEQPGVFSGDAVVVMLTQDLGPCIFFPSFLFLFFSPHSCSWRFTGPLPLLSVIMGFAQELFSSDSG